MNARYYRQRELKKVSTPPTADDMQKYFNMLKPRTVLTREASMKLDKAMKEAESNPIPHEETKRLNDNYERLIANKQPICYMSAPSYDQRVINGCHQCKFKHRCLG